MGNAAVLFDLKQKLGQTLISEKEMWASPHFPGGVARGIVVELLGKACVEWLIELFKHNPETFILWVKNEGHVNPVSLKQSGIELNRLKFITSRHELPVILRLALDCQLYPFIVAPNDFDEVRMFQRFHLLAEKSKSTLFLLGKKTFAPAWPISLQLEIDKVEGQYLIHTHRQKHGVRA